MAVADRFFVTPLVIGIAGGEAPPDALAGAAHAALRRGPLLLTPPGSLHESVRAWLIARGRFASRAVVFGGTAAVSPAVEVAARTAVSER